ncbi:MAG: heavy-metal-associated domain-containing protein [Arenimonas sp.]
MKTFSKIVLAISIFLMPIFAQAKTIEMEVNGLVCAFCAQGIEKTMRKFPATEDVVVSLENKLVAISLKNGQDISDAQLKKAITDAGYTMLGIKRTDKTINDIRTKVKS